MRRTSLVVLLVCACATMLVAAGGASADLFAPIQLVSVKTVPLSSGMFEEQAEEAKDAVVSANGRYVAFVGSFGGVRGIWRRDLRTGAVEQVAPGGSAILPSISEEGRYVSFTTTARLNLEEDHNSAEDVYERDMNKPCQMAGGSCLPCAEHQDEAELETCPFALVSAVNGSAEGVTYEYGRPIEAAPGGSFAGGRQAMNANGQLVVFETEAQSNLLGAPTPAREILLRNLATRETTLVSSEFDPQTGADTGVPVALSGASGSEVGAAYPVTSEGAQGEFGGASISADGSTVAWLGQDIAAQARLLTGEQGTYPTQVDEPLWRHIEAGVPSGATRRATGGSDPEDLACEASGERQLPASGSPGDPCQGPFLTVDQAPIQTQNWLLDAGNGDFVPQLSEHGNRLAFMASAREASSASEFNIAEERDDLYVTEIGNGQPRSSSQRRLTELAGEGNERENAPIVEFAISPDGDQVAFATKRAEFPLGSLTLVSPVTTSEEGPRELYDADVANGTLTRVTHGYAGEVVPSEEPRGHELEGAASPSFSKDGDLLAFASTADNLVFGDGNGASDAFTVERVVIAGSTPQQSVSSPPLPPPLEPAWQLYATAFSEANGSVLIDAEVPGAGVLSASASGRVPIVIGPAHGARGHNRAHGAARSHVALASRTVASARMIVPSGAESGQQLTLALTSAYQSLAQSADGLYTTVTLRFAAPGHPVVSATLRVVFRRAVKPQAAHSVHSARRRKGRRA